MQQKTDQGSSLQKKLALLRCLRSGEYNEAETILASLCVSARTNLALYQQFYEFLAVKKSQIIEIEAEEKGSNQKQIIHTDEESNWNTEDDVSLSSSEEAEQDNQEIFQDIGNQSQKQKSILKKEPKCNQFVVSTKAQPKLSSTSKTVNSKLQSKQKEQKTQ